MIAEIVTEKITYDLEAETAGVVLKILLDEEVDVPVGTPIVVIGQPGEQSADSSGGDEGVSTGSAVCGDGGAAAESRLAPQSIVLPELGRTGRAPSGPGRGGRGGGSPLAPGAAGRAGPGGGRGRGGQARRDRGVGHHRWGGSR